MKDINTQPKSYHDYVFKAGKLIGEFEQMYQESNEVPWHQDETAYAVFSNIDIAILNQYRYSSICEVGCGLGHFTNRLNKELRTANSQLPSVTGIDISSTAIERAKEKFPENEFLTANMIEERPLPGTYFDLIVVKEMFWYIFNHTNKFLTHVKDMVNEGGFLYVSQSFPEEDDWVGKDEIDSPQRLKEILSEVTEPIFHSVEYDKNYNDRPLVHYLGKVKKS